MANKHLPLSDSLVFVPEKYVSQDEESDMYPLLEVLLLNPVGSAMRRLRYWNFNIFFVLYILNLFEIWTGELVYELMLFSAIFAFIFSFGLLGMFRFNGYSFTEYYRTITKMGRLSKLALIGMALVVVLTGISFVVQSSIPEAAVIEVIEIHIGFFLIGISLMVSYPISAFSTFDGKVRKVVRYSLKLQKNNSLEIPSNTIVLDNDGGQYYIVGVTSRVIPEDVEEVQEDNMEAVDLVDPEIDVDSLDDSEEIVSWEQYIKDKSSSGSSEMTIQPVLIVSQLGSKGIAERESQVADQVGHESEGTESLSIEQEQVMEQVRNATSGNPMLLSADLLEMLEEHDVVDEYMARYGRR